MLLSHPWSTGYSHVHQEINKAPEMEEQQKFCSLKSILAMRWTTGKKNCNLHTDGLYLQLYLMQQ